MFPLLLTQLACDGVSSDDSGGASPDGGASDGGASDGGATDGGATDGGATDGGASDAGASDGGATSSFEASFDMVIDGVPYQDECVGSFTSLTVAPGGSPAVDGVIACAWQGSLAQAFGLSTMGGLVDAEHDPKGDADAVHGTWSLGPIQEPWEGTVTGDGALYGAFVGEGELSYGGAEVSYSYQGALSATGPSR